MNDSPVRTTRAQAVQDRILAGVAELLRHGDDLTFAKVALASGVPERTVYRYFPNRPALLAGAYQWANRRIAAAGGERPTTVAGLADLIRHAFPVFDDLAPVVHELLASPDGRAARLADAPQRRDAALALVAAEAPDLDDAAARRVAAVVQVLTSAAAWQALHEHWDMDGTQAAEAAVLAVRLLLDGARNQPPADQEGAP